MFRRICCSLFLISIGVASAEEHVLDKRDFVLPKGTVITSSITQSSKDLKFEIDAGTLSNDMDMIMENSKVEVREVLGENSFSWLLKESTSEQVAKLEGIDQELPGEEEPLLEKLIIFTRKDGKWTGKAKDGELTEEQEEEMAKELKILNKNVSAYGFESRKIGDEWIVKGEALATLMGVEDDMDGGISMKLLSIEEVDGVKCARLKGRVDVRGKTGDETQMSVTGSVEILRDLESFVDLNTGGVLKVRMEMDNEVMKMSGGGKMKLLEKTEIKKPEPR